MKRKGTLYTVTCFSFCSDVLIFLCFLEVRMTVWLRTMRTRLRALCRGSLSCGCFSAQNCGDDQDSPPRSLSFDSQNTYSLFAATASSDSSDSSLVMHHVRMPLPGSTTDRLLKGPIFIPVDATVNPVPVSSVE